MPNPASTPTWAGCRTSPGSKTILPTSRSSPARRTWLPTGTLTSATTWPPPSSARVRSTMITASAPGGMGAPVMIRTAWPGPTATSGALPAANVSTTSRVTGAVAVSAERTA